MQAKVKICIARDATHTVKRHHGIRKTLCNSLPNKERKIPLLYRGLRGETKCPQRRTQQEYNHREGWMVGVNVDRYPGL